MIGLALDFAGPEGQVAIADGVSILHSARRPAGPGTVEGIVPFIMGAIEKAGLALDQVDIVAATTGPGSFTGIRSGLAAAHGLALAHDRPVIGRTVFDTIALSLDPLDHPVLIALDGRRTDLFVQLREGNDTPPGLPANVPANQLAGMVPSGPVRLAGSAAEAARAGLMASGVSNDRMTVLDHARQVDAGRLALYAAGLSDVSQEPLPEPFYGRAPDARPQG